MNRRNSIVGWLALALLREKARGRALRAAIVLLLAGAAGAIFFWRRRPDPEPEPEKEPEPEQTVETAAE